MKNILFITAIAILAISCNPVIYPLPGKNYDDISNIRSDKSLDTVWAITCRIFTEEGYSLKVNNKNNGLITTDKYDFSKHFSFVKNGKPIDSTAWVALSYITNKGGFGSNPFKISANWNVSIKPSGAASIIRIDLSNVDASVTKPAKSTFHPGQQYTFQGQSTGVFEKMLADAVK